jgi:molybdopterin converting factor small subunit
MISVRCMGHIGTSVGAKEVQIEADEIEASGIVERLRGLCAGPDPGFTVFNTLLMVGEGEAFVPAGSKRTVKEGDHVVLIPFSHGG